MTLLANPELVEKADISICCILPLNLHKQIGTHICKTIISYFLFFDGDTGIEQESNWREFAHMKEQTAGIDFSQILDFI